MSSSAKESEEQLFNRMTRQLEVEQQKDVKAKKAGDPLSSVHSITVEWLTDVVCRSAPGAVVTEFRIEPVSTGTQTRDRIHLLYNQAGKTAGLPETLFTKSLPTAKNRVLSGITALRESNFYTTVRPQLDLELPYCYQTTVDTETYAAVHLLEDMVATKGATFPDYRNYIDRDKAEQMVDLLATLHGTFYGSPQLKNELEWAPHIDRVYRAMASRMNIAHYTEVAFDACIDIIPDSLMQRKKEVWPATMKVNSVHLDLPRTIIHCDVHIGNWYTTDQGRMGLTDWQVCSQGHGSRDLAYALSAALTTEDRREWERALVERYYNKLSSLCDQPIDLEQHWNLYRQQMSAGLGMWTITLCHSEHLPHMQTDEMSRAMIQRMTAAMDDLGTLDI